jgi:hypothetical protein
MTIMVAHSSQATILPPNNYGMYDRVDRVANIDEKQFNQIIDVIVAHFAPLAKLHGAELVANKLWTDPTVNASAQQMGSKWIINMYGGLARREEITPDGFAHVDCHELGHQFGGY